MTSNGVTSGNCQKGIL